MLIFQIDLDFENMYQNKGMKLVNQWDNFADKIIPYMLSDDTIKDKWCKTLSAELKNNLGRSMFLAAIILLLVFFFFITLFFTTDSRDCLITILLNALITPTQLSDTSQKKINFKKSRIKTAISTMVVLIQDIQNISVAIKDVQNELKNYYKHQYHPLILVKGGTYSSITEYYIYFDNSTYKLDSFLSCIDMAFKLFNVFNLSYPPHSHGIWIFLQKYFFKFTKKYEKHNSKAMRLIYYLDNCKISS